MLAMVIKSQSLTPCCANGARHLNAFVKRAGQQGGADAQQLRKAQGEWRRRRSLLALELGALLAPLQSPEDVRNHIPTCTALRQRLCVCSASLKGLVVVPQHVEFRVCLHGVRFCAECYRRQC